MKITKTAKAAIDKHALKCYPNECCGLLVDGKFIPAANISPNPTQEFKIDIATYTSALLGGKLQAVIHSHCIDPKNPPLYDPRWASTLDMETWLETDIPWGIIATNGTDVSEILWYDDKDIKPLTGRTFEHGINDCYSIVRDHYRTQLSIQLINVARGMDWWDNGQNLYDENFERAGFYTITEAEADVNDVCLFRVRSPVTNHAAVITGNNEILHHLFHRYSEIDRLDRWRKHIVRYLRYSPELNSISKGNNDASQNTPTRTIS